MDKKATSLVTGGTGFIGRWLLASLTRRGVATAALVRDGEARATELAEFVDRIGGDSSHLEVVTGDVAEVGLGLDEGALVSVRDVYHLAARMELGLSAEQAQVNVAGSVNAIRWAATRPALRRFVYLGGYRVEAMPEWLAGADYPLERPLRRRLYRSYGAYEASKLEAQVAVRRIAGELEVPLTAVNPAGVIGDSRTGETTQTSGVGETVERLWRAGLPALAGGADTFVPLIAVDALAELIATVADNPRTEGAELTALDPSTPELPDLVRRIADHLGVAAPSRMLPLWLIRALPSFATGLDREALGFLASDRYDTAAAEDHVRVAGVASATVDEGLGHWLDVLVSTRFLAAPSAPRGRFVDAGGARTFALGRPETADRVLLHGLPWNANSWEPLLGELGGAASALRPDLPGLGRSAEADSQLDEWLADLTAAVPDPFELVGHSLGTAVAVEYARAHPSRVSRLVLISPAFLQRRAGWLLRRPRLVAAGVKRAKLEGDPEVVASARADLRRPGVARRTAEALARASRIETRRAHAAMLAELAPRIPITVVVGASDPLVESAPDGVEVIEVPGAGHDVHVTHPAETAAAMSRALAALESRTAKGAPAREVIGIAGKARRRSKGGPLSRRRNAASGFEN